MVDPFVFSDEEYRLHVDAIEQRLNELRQQGVDSRTLYGQLCGGWVRWSAGRRAQHRQLLLDLWEKQAPLVPREGKAMFVSGVDGAGKTTAQRDPSRGLNVDRYLLVDPDRIEEAMAERGMIPEVDGLSPMEASPLVREEASDLAERLAQRAYHEMCNVLWEFPMSSDKSVENRIAGLRSAGYGQIDGAFIDADVDTARERTMSRHRRQEEAYRSGRGYGGRLVPQSVVESSRPTPESESPTRSTSSSSQEGQFRIATTDTVRSLIEQYDHGGIEFPTLVAGLVSRWRTRPEKDVEPADWAEVYRRAEEMPDDDLFWVSAAEDLGILTLERAELVFTAIERAAFELGLPSISSTPAPRVRTVGELKPL